MKTRLQMCIRDRVVYTYKGLTAIANAIAHPEEEDDDFLNPEIEDGDESPEGELA